MIFVQNERTLLNEMLTTYSSGRMALSLTIFLVFIFAGCGPAWDPDDPLMDPEELPEPVDFGHCSGFQPSCLAACNVALEPTEATCVNGHWECAGGVDSEVCPQFTGLCDLDSPCGHGYTCVQSSHHPVPSEQGICRKGGLERDVRLENCADWGTLWPSDLIHNHSALVGRVIKFAARVGVTLQCFSSACFGQGECCGDCVGNYATELTLPFGHASPLTMLIRTEGLACQGNPCDVSCSPLTVGETYRMWGVLSECSGSESCTFLLMGACPL